jgi:ankyrin repeat protein
MIQSYIKNPEEFEKDWRIIFKTMPREMLSEFGILVKHFYKSFPSRFEDNWSPMHIAAEHGHLDFCRLIAKVSPTKRYTLSPLLFSAQAGNLEVSKFIFKEIEVKTVRSHLELTAQHLAAKNGHFEIYKFLHENLNDINPIMQERITPLHLAAQNGHFNICKYICDNTALIGPYRSDKMTPLSLAIYRGHFKIARLLIQRYANIPWSALILICFILIRILSSLLYSSFLGIFLFLIFDIDPPILLVSKGCSKPVEFIAIFLIVPKIVSRLIVDYVRFSKMTMPKLDY